ncbi:MAG TPA: amino acid racemase [bacterium]|nr:amino acid racemase [bacterium]
MAGERGQWIVGVLGGMGPLATADFYRKLVHLTPARTDQDHLRVIIDSNPKIPDRTAALRGEGPDPTPALVATARALERAGVDLIAIPCNSAHAFLPAVRQSVRVPVLDIMAEVAAAAAALTPRPQAAGLLATAGTVETRLYHRALAARGIDVVDATPPEQARVAAAIGAVKAGDLGPAVREHVRAVAAALTARGAQVIVLGCTEIPMVTDPGELPVPVLDGTEILAAAAVRDALSADRPAEEFPVGGRRISRLQTPGETAAPGSTRGGAGKPDAGSSEPARRP